MPPDLSLRGGRRPTWRPERAARGSALGVQSRRTRPHRGKAIGENATAFPRLPRRFAPRNDTSGGCGGAPELSSGLMPLCKAVTDRRYRRNWSVRFIDALYELQVPSRDCHVALLLAMTRQADAAVHQRPHAVECSPTGRSLSAATDAIGPCVLSTPCTNCKCLPEIATSLRSSQ